MEAALEEERGAKERELAELRERLGAATVDSARAVEHLTAALEVERAKREEAEAGAPGDEGLADQVEALQAQLDEATAQAEQAEALQAQLDEATAQAEQAETRAADAAATELRSQLRELRLAAADLESIRAESEFLRDELDGARDRLEELEEADRRAEHARAALAELREESERQAELAAQREHELRERLSASEGELEAMAKRFDDLADVIASARRGN